MFLDCDDVYHIERREYISYILYLDFTGAIQIVILLNFTTFQNEMKILKKIGGMVPDIYDVFSFHATHFPSGARKLSCAATSSTFPMTP